MLRSCALYTARINDRWFYKQFNIQQVTEDQIQFCGANLSSWESLSITTHTDQKINQTKGLKERLDFI